MSEQNDAVPKAPEIDEYDLSIEKLVAPEITKRWWPEAVPTDGPAPAP